MSSMGFSTNDLGVAGLDGCLAEEAAQTIRAADPDLQLTKILSDDCFPLVLVAVAREVVADDSVMTQERSPNR